MKPVTEPPAPVLDSVTSDGAPAFGVPPGPGFHTAWAAVAPAMTMKNAPSSASSRFNIAPRHSNRGRPPRAPYRRATTERGDGQSVPRSRVAHDRINLRSDPHGG